MRTGPALIEELIESPGAEKLAGGFGFVEGPLWHPEGYWLFVDIPANRLYRLRPGGDPQVVREDTGGGNGLTFDAGGRLVMCEMDRRRVVRHHVDGSHVEVLCDGFEGRRLNRPNDVVCRSDGSIWFTDPGGRLALVERDLPSRVYRVAPDGCVTAVGEFELPNGLAFTADERAMYVANSRATMYVVRLALDPDGSVRGRRIFADLSSDEPVGVPDGLKVDGDGRVWCCGPGGIWVFDHTGARLCTVRLPEQPANLAFGEADRRTLFVTARTSVYALRTRASGLPDPWSGGHGSR